MVLQCNDWCIIIIFTSQIVQFLKVLEFTCTLVVSVFSESSMKLTGEFNGEHGRTIGENCSLIGFVKIEKSYIEQTGATCKLHGQRHCSVSMICTKLHLGEKKLHYFQIWIFVFKCEGIKCRKYCFHFLK